MFKFMKQGVSLAAAVAAAGSCIPVYAAGIQPRTSVMASDGSGNTETGNGEEGSGTSITIAEPVEGHRYKVYQVFKGRVSSDSTKLSNVEYGANYSGREGVALKDELAQLEAEGAEAKAFAETVRGLLRGEPAAVLSVENPTAELEAGNYMILDETLYEVDGDSLSDYIVTVAGNVTVQPKSTGVPEFDKSIDDGKGDNGGNDENGGSMPDTEEPDAPSFEVPEDADISPETADIDWNYTLHEDTGVITLNYYIGTKTDVKVYSHYRAPEDGKIYKAELKSSDGIYSESYMFSERSDITSVIFSDKLDTSTCTSMMFMFYECMSLESIDFGVNFSTKNVCDMEHMFYNCNSLITLDVSCFDTSNVTNMMNMFNGCRELMDIDVSCFDTSKTVSMSGMFYDCEKLTDINVGRFNTSNVIDMNYMFNNCSSLTSIDVSRFNTSKVTDMSGMFYQSLRLSNIDVSSFDTSKVINMGYMFGGCGFISELDVSGFDTSSVTNMEEMFGSCGSLTNIDVSSFDTSKVTNMARMFQNCQIINFLNLKNFDTQNVTDMSYMFQWCSNLKNIEVMRGMWIMDNVQAVDIFLGCGVSEVTYATKTSSVLSKVLLLASASEMTEEDTISEEYIEIEDDDTSVDYSIGDSIPYRLTATMPESITAYKKYQLAFHDKLSAGLDYDRDSLKVFAGDTEIPAEHYTVAYSEDGKSMTVSIADVKAAPWNAVPGTQIIVKYSAVLNENAQAGNTNEAFLEYSNDPKGDGTGTTGPGVPDIVTVYTFELRFDKVDKNGNALEGAGFTLYKKNDAGEFVPAGDEIKGLTRFSFKGLAAGEYKLVETTTPDGYNTMEDLYFNIVAEEAESGGETVKRISIEAPDGSPLSGWTAIGADKAFESDIANYTGSTLPETGGAGTYLLYAAGVAVVITAGTVIAARKKADEE